MYAESLSSEEKLELERHQLAAATRIMQEANDAAGLDTLSEWESKAEELVKMFFKLGHRRAKLCLQ